MIGQYTEQEFYRMYDSAIFKKINLSSGLAWIQKGKTTNYYRKEEDGSWTNYNCMTEG